MNNGPLIQKEKKIVTHMIALYCRKHHHFTGTCEECADLTSYALQRLVYCRFGESKSTCASCPIHCYKPDYRSQIKAVMRFAGPRMLLRHPIYCMKHIVRKK